MVLLAIVVNILFAELPGVKDILSLPKLERLIMEYFLKHISVGEIISVIEIREEIKRLRDPELVPEFDDVIIELTVNRAIARLVGKKFLVHESGCYNLNERIREEIKRAYGELRPGFSKDIYEILERIENNR